MQGRVVCLLGVDDIGEGNEAEPSHVVCVESAVVGCRVLPVRMCRIDRESGMVWLRGVDAVGCPRDGYGRRLMGGVCDDFHIVRIQVVVCYGH